MSALLRYYFSSRSLMRASVPSDYDDLLSYYTKRGYRVIAMAGKSIEGLSWLKAQKLKRYVIFGSWELRSANIGGVIESKRNRICSSLG